MFYIKKRIEVSASHKLALDYPSKCENLHGHNWIITVFCKSEKLDKNGMVIDFTRIKKFVHDRFDHKNLNEILEQPTAENIACTIADTIPECYKVEVIESEGNTVIYTKEQKNENI